MPTLLRIDTSMDIEGSRTRALTEAFAKAWVARGGDYVVTTRDLHADPLPLLTTPAQHWPPNLRDGASVPDGFDALQQGVIDELLAADVVVIGAPMYNYAMPATLKAWIDVIHIPAVTAPFLEPIQPMKGRPVVVMAARGGFEDPTDPDDGWDCVMLPLRRVFGPIGLGMDVHQVTTSRTLADKVPALGADLAAQELADATALATDMANRLG